jgi:uncharacterized membrane protein
VDGTLVFGTPLVAFGLQTALVREMEFGAAWSAFAVGAFYLVLATVLYARKRESLQLLVESFHALGVGFATHAVTLALDGRWTSAAWAVEGAAIVWVGMRQGRVLPRAFGMVLQFGAGIAFLLDAHGGSGGLAVLNSHYLGTVMVSVAALFCSRYLDRNRERIGATEAMVATALFVWGVLWWFGGGLAEIDRQVPDKWGLHPHLLYFAGSCALFGLLWRRLRWDAARFVALASVPLGALTAMLMLTPPAMINRLRTTPTWGGSSHSQSICRRCTLTRNAPHRGLPGCTRAVSGCSPWSPRGRSAGRLITTLRAVGYGRSSRGRSCPVR